MMRPKIERASRSKMPLSREQLPNTIHVNVPAHLPPKGREYHSCAQAVR